MTILSFGNTEHWDSLSRNVLWKQIRGWLWTVQVVFLSMFPVSVACCFVSFPIWVVLTTSWLDQCHPRRWFGRSAFLDVLGLMCRPELSQVLDDDRTKECRSEGGPTGTGAEGK